MIRTVIGAALLLADCLVFIISLIGVFRFRYVLNRIHAASLSDTLGTLLVIAGLIVLKGFCFTSLKYLLMLVVLWITAPVATNRIGKAEATTNLSIHDEYEVEK